MDKKIAAKLFTVVSVVLYTVSVLRSQQPRQEAHNRLTHFIATSLDDRPVTGKDEFLSVEPTPVAPSFVFVDDKVDAYSSAHCFGSHMQTQSWRTTACRIRNFCFNFTSKQFIYYTGSSMDPGPEDVAITVLNYRWITMYDSVIKYKPLIRAGPLPAKRWQSSDNELHILHLSHVPSNPGHLFWDDYWTYFMLPASVLSRHESVSKKLRPIWFNINDNPPWATCDWIRQHSGPGHSLPASQAWLCEKINNKWFRHFLGEGHKQPPETNWWLKDEKDLLSRSEMFCLSDTVLGSGATSRNGGGHDGWNEQDPHPPTAGRSPLIQSLRNHFIRRAGLADIEQFEELQIFFSLRSSARLSWDMKAFIQTTENALSDLNELARKVSGSSHVKVTIHSQTLAILGASEQMKTMARTAVYVGVAGGGAMSAQFLPPGAGMILYYAPQDIHAGKDDWKIFSMYSPVRVTFVHKNDNGQPEFLRLLKNEIANCASFMPISGMNTM